MPFVGPAGRLLDRALEAAGLDRSTVYLTNAVKHFKYELRGKRRMHKTPAQREVEACAYWLERELARVAPRVIVALGATALGAVHPDFHGSLGSVLDQVIEQPGRSLVAAYHPSFVLRQRDEVRRQAVFETLVSALRRARELAE